MTSLSDRELDRIETQLSAMCDELRREIAGEQQDIRDLVETQGDELTSQYQGDVSSDPSLQDRALGTQQALKGELQVVEQALNRLAEGTYGTCASCGALIAPERLEARPQAIRCLECERKSAVGG